VTCLAASACSLASWVLLSAGQTGWVLLLARTLTGLTDSLVMPAGIMFISDVAETRLR
jgi:MFS family permease